MNNTTETLSVKEKVGYSLGDLSANLIFQTFITFLAFFYTDVYRIPAGTAATIIFTGGLLGAFVFTPIVGLFGIENAIPMGSIMAITAVVSAIVLLVVVRPRTVPALSH